MSRREDDEREFRTKSPEHSKNVIQNVKITHEISYNTQLIRSLIIDLFCTLQGRRGLRMMTKKRKPASSF
jgi:hypothetical protein